MKNKKRHTLWRLFGFLGKWRAAYIASLVGLAVVLTSERMFVAYVIKLFVDSISQTNIDLLWYSVKIWAIFLLGWIPLAALLGFLWRSTTMSAMAQLRQTIFEHMQRLPLGYYEHRGERNPAEQENGPDFDRIPEQVDVGLRD